jgi:hypothetical protein
VPAGQDVVVIDNDPPVDAVVTVTVAVAFVEPEALVAVSV